MQAAICTHIAGRKTAHDDGTSGTRAGVRDRQARGEIGNAAHINVQLIRASNDGHLWAESYNRKLDDVFGVEGEVAGAIAEQLNAKLSGNEKQELAAKPTTNAEAYDADLRGLALFERADLLDEPARGRRAGHQAHVRPELRGGGGRRS